MTYLGRKPKAEITGLACSYTPPDLLCGDRYQETLKLNGDEIRGIIMIIGGPLRISNPFQSVDSTKAVARRLSSTEARREPNTQYTRGAGIMKRQNARVETFVVGQDVEGLLISETVVPGFEIHDHDFMPAETLPDLVSAEQSDELHWLLMSFEGL
ncbi:MAG: hypothetical protein FRX48_03718 [Lasallia pustulata]|uniref:Uncharacterized protein n=1 Tax=Lasallia pustulata TaxID=136370 RepID=A0A5M8PT17_9LECA|nr:MAG: hypothetical protein FRX48_03718 [Lasallia pustulata]